MAGDLLIANGTVLTPERALARGAVRVAQGRIVAVTEAETAPAAPGRVIDATGLTVVPGFIDLQCNGGFGHDFTGRPEAIWEVAAALPRYGVTAFLPTIITAPSQTIARAQEVVQQAPPEFRGATPLGLHLEGPFLNRAKKGAHNAVHLREPNPALVAGWSAGAGVRLVTLAPELAGALDVVRRLVQQGVVAGAGHTAATYTEMAAAFSAGIRYGTHLFNAMAPLHQREPGPVGALLDDERLTVGLIPDGIHVHPALVRLAWQRLGPGRLNVVTDAIAALGMPPGRYRLGGQPVIVDEERARLADGTLAGSVLSLDAALRRLRAFTGCSLQEALATVTTTPARLLGLAGARGRLAPGYAADLVLLGENGEVVATVVAGRFVYQKEEDFHARDDTF
jgi:N-acetylglucosamine-6-phosphate deacetylase